MSTTPAAPASPQAPQPAPPAPARKSSRCPEEVVFVAYPKILFLWPLILAGYIFALFAGALNPGALETLGWVYLTIAVLVLLTVSVDVNRNQAIFLGVLIFALWILGLYLDAVKSIPIFGWIFNWFAALDVQYNRAFGLALSVVLSIPTVVLIALAYLNDRWRINHNEFEHYSFGKMDDSLGRGAKIIRTEFPDMLELLLGGAGTLIVYSAGGSKELRRIPHVMFLPMVRRKLNLILETVAVEHVGAHDDEEEEAL